MNLRRVKYLAKKIKEKNITVRDVSEKELYNEYQCFRSTISSYGLRGNVLVKPWHAQRAREEIKQMIAKAVLCNNDYDIGTYPTFLIGLHGKCKRVNLKDVVFANKYIYKGYLGFKLIYECYVKTEFKF